MLLCSSGLKQLEVKHRDPHPFCQQNAGLGVGAHRLSARVRDGAGAADPLWELGAEGGLGVWRLAP